MALWFHLKVNDERIGTYRDGAFALVRAGLNAVLPALALTEEVTDGPA